MYCPIGWQQMTETIELKVDFDRALSILSEPEKRLIWDFTTFAIKDRDRERAIRKMKEFLNGRQDVQARNNNSGDWTGGNGSLVRLVGNGNIGDYVRGSHRSYVR